MSVVEMLYRAYKIKLALNRLSRAKERAVREHIGLPPKLSCWEECSTAFMDSLRTACCEIFTPCCVFKKPNGPKVEIPNTPFKRLMVKGTYENDLLKNCLGFAIGCTLTIILYLIMIFQMNLSPTVSSIASSFIGVFFTIGIAFSPNARLMVVLMVPQFFTSKGRSFLLMYAVVLVLNHPVQNFNQNILVMTESSTCSQEMAFNQTKQLAEAAMAPLAGIINVVKKLMEALKMFARLIKKAFIALKKAILEIAAVIKALFDWLKSIVSICNDKLGGPYRRCNKAFNSAERRCKDALGVFSFVCNIVTAISFVCYICKISTVLCAIAGLIKDLIVAVIVAPAKSACEDIKTMFAFNVTIDYNYEYNLNQTKTYSQVRKDIMQEIIERTSSSKACLGFLSDALFVTVFFVLIRAVIYRKKYLTNDRFDNFYLTYKVEEVNERRKQMGKETLFPLTNKEKRKYIKSTSMRLAKNERKKLLKGIILLVIAGCHTSFYLLNDYGLWWLLMMMQKHLAKKITHNVPPHLKMHVQGKGAMSDMYRSMVSMFDPVAETGVELDATACLPYPYEPNWKIYDEIGVIYGVCFFLVIFEAYGLRLRHMICGLVYPKREKERGVWLFNHILKLRGGFMKYKRRKARQQFSNRKNLEEASMVGKLAAQYPIMRKLFKYFGWDNKACLLCGREGRKNDMDNFNHCANLDCEAVYCVECFLELNNICTVCMNPVDYGDISDFSEERDSSEDEKEYLRKKAEAKKRKEDRLAEAAKIAAENTHSQVMLKLGFTGPPQVKPDEASEGEDENVNSGDDLSDITNNALMRNNDFRRYTIDTNTYQENFNYSAAFDVSRSFQYYDSCQSTCDMTDMSSVEELTKTEGSDCTRMNTLAEQDEPEKN